MSSSSTVDRLLIEAYSKHMSVEEASEYTNIPVDEVARRTTEALGKRDYLGETARIELLMRKLEAMADEVQTRLNDASDRNLGALVNSASGALGRVLGQLTKIQASSRVDVNAITANQSKVLAELINIPIQHLRDELKERYPTDDDEIDELVLEGIRMAYAELESRVDS